MPAADTKKHINSTSWKKGQSGNPTGLSNEDRENMLRARELLLNPGNDAVWAASYVQAMRDGVPQILLDYANRRLGKPKESLEVTGRVESPMDSLNTEDLVRLARAQPELPPDGD